MYLVDSQNFATLDQINEGVVRRQIDHHLANAELGIKLADHFTMKMCVQRSFDLRRMVAIFSDCFLSKEPDLLPKYYTQIMLHRNLRCLNAATKDLQRTYKSNFESFQKFRLKYGRREGHPEKENRKEWLTCQKRVFRELIMPRDRIAMLRDLKQMRKTCEKWREDNAKKNAKKS